MPPSETTSPPELALSGWPDPGLSLSKSGPPFRQGVSLSLLLISTIWITIWITLIHVARHAEAFQKIHAAQWIIWNIGLLMILTGAYGATLAIDELARNKTTTLRVIATWLWFSAATIALGRIASPRYWPWIELFIATILTAIAPFAIKFANKKRNMSSLLNSADAHTNV